MKVKSTHKGKSVKGSFENLTKAQIEFIQAKVVELGGVQEVEAFYNNNDTVGEFARLIARGLYGKAPFIEKVEKAQ